MVFTRSWDSSCPRVWDSWEADGRTWVIQDLPPADDDKAVDLLVEHLLPDETLCVLSNVCDDPQSVRSFRDIWKAYVGQRMNLACYTEVEGQETLVALNACYVACKGEDDEQEYKGESCKNVIAVLKYYKTRCDSFDLLGVDQLLNALGLVVMRQYRGLKLGERLLAAREPLCRSLDIKGSETIFTGPASQKLAARCGFKSVLEISMRELAAIGLKYPQDDRVIKVMIKKYK